MDGGHMTHVNEFLNRPVSAFRRSPGRTAGVVVAIAAVLVSSVGAIPARADASPCGPTVNAIVCENNQPGNPPSDWDISGAGDSTIQGYATDISVNVGQPIDFKIKTDASTYTIDIYRLGWYGGNGARFVQSVSLKTPLPVQDACITSPSTGLADCGNWKVSATWNVPATAVSGVYIAKLTRTHQNADDGASHITFVVRNDASTSDLFFQTSDTTWHAYNLYGGADAYPGGTGPDRGRAYKLSYNRPFGTRGDNSGRDFLFSNEYPMIRFLERNGYDMSYTTGLDSDRRGNLIKNHKVFLSTGHDEYWSGQQRANVEAARDAGVNLAFFSGNEVYWKTRWEPSADGQSTPNRTLVVYKETWANAKIDPSTEWTGTWRDPRFTPPSNGNRPENALTGTAYMSNSDDLALTVPPEQGKYRLWRGSDVASRAGIGLSTTLAEHTIGYESNEDLDNGFRPAGLIRLSTTVGATPEYLRDFGNTVTPGTTTHHLTLYKAPSGALVFSAGTIQWAWGLDDQHDGTQSPADMRMQQATVNILADMHVQPTRLMSSLAAVGASTDTTAPTASISSPVTGGSVASGAQVTVQGTASDAGGRVAGVEVSTDGGTTWHPATGTTSWSYTFFASGISTQSIQARAVDDSANIGPSTATVQLNITGRYTIFGNRTPVNPSTNDSPAVELGVKFYPQTDGYITGVRFYKGAGNTGTHTGSLWNGTGTRLATGIFTGETASGWQTLTFANPVPVTQNTTYVASYLAPAGHYAADSWVFSTGDFVSAPLAAKRSLGTDTNGLFRYGGGFPNQSFGDSNYYVDVTFISSAAPAPSVVSVTPAANASNVPVAVHPTALFSKPIDPATIQFTLRDAADTPIAGSVAYDATSRTATLTPSAALGTSQTYTATVQARDTQGHLTDAPMTWSFTTDAYTQVLTLFAASSVPSIPAVDDRNAVELGVRFVPAANGLVIGVRFYQGPGNTGTHTGSLWNSTGALLAKATFTGESGSGWQEVRFSSPVAVNAGTAYVASYYAPNGNYAANANFFASRWTNGPLSAPSASNGVYRYGSDAFPSNSYNATNYWVDPLFVPSGASGPPPAVSLFDDGSTPANASWSDNGPISVGVKFTSDVSGSATGVRFYKGPTNTGTHVGALWTSSGQLLANATFTNETASGWQTVTFAQPVPITAGTTYVASYFAPVGQYAVNLNAFSSPFDNPPLHVPAGGGLYHYSNASAFPDGSSNHNFWVDVIVQPDS